MHKTPIGLEQTEPLDAHSYFKLFPNAILSQLTKIKQRKEQNEVYYVVNYAENAETSKRPNIFPDTFFLGQQWYMKHTS